MNKLIAVTIGDINGIGIELMIKSWKKKEVRNFVLFCNENLLRRYLKKNNIKININNVNNGINNINFKVTKFNIFDYNAKSNEENSINSLKQSYLQCKYGNFIGIVTLPINKNLIIKKISSNFIGHTEYFQNLDGKNVSNMILINKKIIVCPLTTHISLKSVPKYISKKNYIFNKIVSLNETLKYDLNINNPKLIISGLNPHSGENGKFGNEETKYIIPEIQRCKNKGIDINGPVSADSCLTSVNMKKYSCFIFLYHDQALIPYKYISNFKGVNYTGNLDVIRTSPDHGTAYDLIGSNKVSNKSLINCFKTTMKIYSNRNKNNDKGKKIS